MEEEIAYRIISIFLSRNLWCEHFRSSTWCIWLKILFLYPRNFIFIYYVFFLLLLLHRHIEAGGRRQFVAQQHIHDLFCLSTAFFLLFACNEATNFRFLMLFVHVNDRMNGETRSSLIKEKHKTKQNNSKKQTHTMYVDVWHVRKMMPLNELA